MSSAVLLFSTLHSIRFLLVILSLLITMSSAGLLFSTSHLIRFLLMILSLLFSEVSFTISGSTLGISFSEGFRPDILPTRPGFSEFFRPDMSYIWCTQHIFLLTLT